VTRHGRTQATVSPTH